MIDIDHLPCALYRLFDGDNRLLYVGITESPKVRFKAHAKDKDWWPQVARHSIEWLADRPTALAAERAAIIAENPINNIERPSEAGPSRRVSPRCRPASPEMRAALTDVSTARAAADERVRVATEQCRRLVVEAWRAGIPPSEIEALSGWSPAYVRRLRPDDVPPLRMGGGAAPKKRARRKP